MSASLSTNVTGAPNSLRTREARNRICKRMVLMVIYYATPVNTVIRMSLITNLKYVCMDQNTKKTLI